MGETLADRIRQRLDALGYTANAASQKAKLDRDYIGDMLKLFDDGKIQNPRMDTIQKLAYGLSCDPYWLATGKAPAAEDDQIQEAISLMADLSDDQRENALAILRALHDRTHPKQTG